MRFKHINRGSEYEILDILQVKDQQLFEDDVFTFIEDGEEVETSFQFSRSLKHPLIKTYFDAGLVVIYYALDTGEMYSRPADEFFDGRFERI